MTDKTYNGWTNYATWRINLEMWDGFKVEHFEFADVDSIANYFKESSEEIINESSDGLAHSYAMAFLSEVNWYEIAQHKADECELFNNDENE